MAGDPVLSVRLPEALAARLGELAGTDRSVSSVLREAVERLVGRGGDGGVGGVPPTPPASSSEPDDEAALDAELVEALDERDRARQRVSAEKLLEGVGAISGADAFDLLVARKLISFADDARRSS